MENLAFPSFNLCKNMFDLSQQYIAVLDISSRFVYLNNRHADVIGYQAKEEALGISYHEFKCNAVENHQLFTRQDVEVLSLKKSIIFLSYYCLHNNIWRLLYGEKSPILNQEGEAINIFSATQDITSANLIDLSRFLVNDNQLNTKKIKQKSFTYYISKDEDSFAISKKEQEVLFFFIRGKNAQEISNILSRSKRTIEMHIEVLKEKLQVFTKSQLIEKAIMLGYMTKIPETLLAQCKLASS